MNFPFSTQDGSQPLAEHLASRKDLEPYLSTPLRGVHCYENVSYIPCTVLKPSSGNWITSCNLCEVRLFKGTYDAPGTPVQITALEEHVRSEQHETRYFQLVQAQKQAVRKTRRGRLEKSEFLRDRAKRLKLPRWRWHVNDLVMQYIDKPFPEHHRRDEQVPSPPPPPTNNLTAALTQLAKYEQTERLTLLELAIIKSNLCYVPAMKEKMEDGDSKSTFISLDITPSKMVKSGAAVIIPLVVSFLGKPPPLDS